MFSYDDYFDFWHSHLAKTADYDSATDDEFAELMVNHEMAIDDAIEAHDLEEAAHFTEHFIALSIARFGIEFMRKQLADKLSDLNIDADVSDFIGDELIELQQIIIEEGLAYPEKTEEELFREALGSIFVGRDLSEVMAASYEQANDADKRVPIDPLVFEHPPWLGSMIFAIGDRVVLKTVNGDSSDFVGTIIDILSPGRFKIELDSGSQIIQTDDQIERFVDSDRHDDNDELEPSVGDCVDDELERIGDDMLWVGDEGRRVYIYHTPSGSIKKVVEVVNQEWSFFGVDGEHRFITKDFERVIVEPGFDHFVVYMAR
jgi:hypothetical protein